MNTRWTRLGSFLWLISMLVATPSRVFTADSAPAMTARESGAGLYSRQDVESDRIATLEKGEALTPIAESVGSEIWYMVRRQQGSVGWVRAADVILSNQAKDAFKEKQPSSSTWSARTSGGRTFNGTWSLAPEFDRSTGRRCLDVEQRQRHDGAARQLERRKTCDRLERHLAGDRGGTRRRIRRQLVG